MRKKQIYRSTAITRLFRRVKSSIWGKNGSCRSGVFHHGDTVRQAHGRRRKAEKNGVWGKCVIAITAMFFNAEVAEAAEVD